MRFVWISYHAEGLPALEGLLADGAPLRDVFTLKRGPGASPRGGLDLRGVCRRHGVELHEVSSLNSPEAIAALEAIAPDVAFVIGWPEFIRPRALHTARIGMIGAHASLLPHNRGSAPLNWAIIHGEKESGSTLYWLSDSAEDGDLIDQVRFPISEYDTFASLSAQVAQANRTMLRSLVPRLLAGEVPRVPRPAETEPANPRRRAADGLVDWAQSMFAVYDFIRALTRPAPGAFSSIAGGRWRVWQAALPRAVQAAVPPGTVLGPVVSPVDEACGQLVACADGAIVLLEVEREDGRVLRGRALSEQRWTGQRWGHA